MQRCKPAYSWGKKYLFYLEGMGLHFHRAKSSWYVLNESATQHKDGGNSSLSIKVIFQVLFVPTSAFNRKTFASLCSEYSVNFLQVL